MHESHQVSDEKHFTLDLDVVSAARVGEGDNATAVLHVLDEPNGQSGTVRRQLVNFPCDFDLLDSLPPLPARLECVGAFKHRGIAFPVFHIHAATSHPDGVALKYPVE